MNTKELTQAIISEVGTDTMIARGQCSDLDNVPMSGCYSLYNPQNAPFSNLYGVLFHARITNIVQAQLVLTNLGRMLFRTKWEVWKSWREVTAATLP